MFEIDTPQSTKGILLALFIIFVIVSALITTGTWPVILAIVVGGAAAYLAYVVLVRIHRVFVRGSLRSRSGGGDS